VELEVTGSTPDVVSLDDGADDAASKRAGGRGGVAVAPLGSWGDDYDPRILAYLEKHVEECGVILAAGEAGRLRALGLPIDSYDVTSAVLWGEKNVADSDEGKLAALVQNLEETEAARWVDERYRRADEVLTRRWDQVVALAAALVERRTLRRRDLCALLGVEPDQSGLGGE
jgi:hypothetical protein